MIPSPIFVCGTNSRWSTRVVEALRALGRDASVVEWSSKRYALSLESTDVSLHLAVDRDLRGAWLLIGCGDEPSSSLSEIADYCRSKEMRFAVLVSGAFASASEQNQVSTFAQVVALADLVLPDSASAADEFQRLWHQRLRLPPSQLPRVTVISSPALAEEVACAVDKWLPLRRVWCYVDTASRVFPNATTQPLGHGVLLGLREAGLDVTAVTWDVRAQALRILLGDHAEQAAGHDSPRPLQPCRGDWLIIPEISMPPRPPPGALIKASRRMGLSVAYVFSDPDLFESAAGLHEEIWHEILGANAILPFSEMAEAKLWNWIRLSKVKQTGLDHRIVTPSSADECWRHSRENHKAQARPTKTWECYAREIVMILGTLGPRSDRAIRALPAFQPTPLSELSRPLLSICITTYNRAAWLEHTLPRLLRLSSPYRDMIEIVVCDNASTDSTSDVADRSKSVGAFLHQRNVGNVGLIGNLAVTTGLASGQYVWLLGDDDVLVEGAIEDVLEGLAGHPDVEMAYLNYSVTYFNDPARLTSIDELIGSSVAVADGGRNRRVEQLREVATITENLFTAIYACIFRRDHAMRAFDVGASNQPFSSLRASAPSAEYVMRMMLDRPAYWIGQPRLVVNMNVSWSEWQLLWRLERLPELYDWLEREGLGGPRIDYYRWMQASDAARWVRDLFFEASELVRSQVNIRRFIDRTAHIETFRLVELPKIHRVLEDAVVAGKIGALNSFGSLL